MNPIYVVTIWLDGDDATDVAAELVRDRLADAVTQAIEDGIARDGNVEVVLEAPAPFGDDEALALVERGIRIRRIASGGR